MPAIAPNDFLKVVDRLAALYQGILELETQVGTVATRASLELPVRPGSVSEGNGLYNGTGYNGAPYGFGGSSLQFTARKPGSDGNLISVEYRDPGVANAALRVEVLGSTVTTEGRIYDAERALDPGIQVVVHLATGSGGVITTTSVQIKATLEGEPEVERLLTIGQLDAGTSPVAPSPPTNLAGGLHGLLRDVMLEAEDADVSTLVSAAIQLDTKVTAPQIALGTTYFSNLVTALRSHLGKVNQRNLIDGYCADNNLRVHENFDVLHQVAIGIHLDSTNVFRGDQAEVARLVLGNTGVATATIQPVGARARLQVQTSDSGSAVLYTAASAGVGGNSITVGYVVPLLSSQPLYVEVEGRDILVHLATDSGGLVTTSATAAAAAVNANAASAALVVATVPGSGATLLAAASVARLTNLDTAVKFTSLVSGAEGNEISVRYIDPGLTSQATSSSVGGDGRTITIQLSTDGSGALTALASDVIAAVVADSPTSALITATASGAVTGKVSPVSATFLSGGTPCQVVTSTALGAGSGLAGVGNYAAQEFLAQAYPASRAAKLVFYPTGSTAFAVVDPGVTDTQVRYTAGVSGLSGNSISVSYVYSSVPSTVLSVAVTSTAIVVTLATDAGSRVTSTAAQVAAAVNANATASGLVVASPVTAGAGLMVPVAPVFLTNTRTKVLYTAAVAGRAGEQIQVEYLNPGASLSPLGVTVSGLKVSVRLATDSSSKVVSTPLDIIAAVNASTAAHLLVVASEVVPGMSTGVVAAQVAQNLDDGAGPFLVRDTAIDFTLLRSDGTAVVRRLTFPAGCGPGTPVAVGARLATASLGDPTLNGVVLYSAAQSGASGNGTIIQQVVPSKLRSPLSVTVTQAAAVYPLVGVSTVSVSLATDYSGRPVSTALDVAAAVNANASCAGLVVASVSGWGFGYTASGTVVLAGGSDPEKFFSVTAAQVALGGEHDDQFSVLQKVERVVTL